MGCRRGDHFYVPGFLVNANKKEIIMKIFNSLTIGLIILSSVAFARNDRATMNLFVACQFNNIDDVQKYIQEGANINATDNMGYTPLYYAMSKGNRDIMDILLANGADINQQVGHSDESYGFNDKMPLLMMAVRSDNKNTTIIFQRNNQRFRRWPSIFYCSN